MNRVAWFRARHSGTGRGLVMVLLMLAPSCGPAAEKPPPAAETPPPAAETPPPAAEMPPPAAETPQSSMIACHTGDAAYRFHLPSEATWDLKAMDPELVEFYQAIGQRLGLSLESVLGELADDYYTRLNSFERFQGILGSLKNLVESRDPQLAELASQPDDNDDEVIIYVDPVCDHCQKVVEKFQRLWEFCGGAPKPDFRLLPGSDERSIRAAAWLAVIHEHSPRWYTEAINEFLFLLPTGRGDAASLAEDYLAGLDPEIRVSAVEAASQRLKGRQTEFPATDHYAPLIIFRSRSITENREGPIPFDPFRKESVLLVTLRFIQASDMKPDL